MAAETVGHYRLMEPLGAGGMGQVYLAEDQRLHRLVALKLLPADRAGDAAAIDRLLREARVASSLTHPNIATVYDVGESQHEGRRAAFIAMEYVAGRTLADVIQSGPLGPSEALPIARQLADALAHAHEHGVVHRDIKPGNLMLTERGLLKVLDFGLARSIPTVEDDSTWSGHHAEPAGGLAGTLAYMSPEQVRGGDVDAQSDVFSAGVVLYELLAGSRPFGGQTTVDVIAAILSKEPPPLRAEGPLAAGLSQLALAMLEKDAARRPSGMARVGAELDRVAAGHAPSIGSGGDLTVAVLGFDNLTGQPEDAWVGAGLAETVAAGLGSVTGLHVLSRERIVEALRAIGQGGDYQDPARAGRIGREAGARMTVNGAYQILGDQIRVTARVTDAASDRVEVSPQVDGALSRLFDVQDRLVAELAAGLRRQVPVRVDDTRSLEAYEACSRGLLNLQAETPDSLDRAIVCFERASLLDPAYARAHMLLGAALDLKGDYLTVRDLCARALASLDRAIALRDTAEAWRFRGSALISLGRDDEALDAFDRALARNPMDASAHAGIGRVRFILRGDFAGAIPAYVRALALNPNAGWAALQLAHCAALARDFTHAEAAATRAVALQQAFLSGRTGMVIVGAHVRLGQIRALQDRPRDALDEYAREVDFVSRVDHALRARVFIELQQRIGEAYLQIGERAQGLAALDLALEAYDRRMKSVPDDPMSPYYAACAHALRGDIDAAVACLERTARFRPMLTARRAAV